MSDATRLPIPASLRRSPIVAVLRARHAAEYAPVVEALVAGGVIHVELTLSTAGVFAEMSGLRERFGSAASIGIGTITSRSQAERAIEAGAEYLVTPAMLPEVIAVARAAGIPVFPGGFTPTELFTGWEAGATAVKVFPASRLGAGYLTDLRGPFPGIEVVPSGGLTVEDAAAWLRAGACAVSLGGPLLRDAFDGGSLGALTERARELGRTISELRGAGA
ncbi:bifunctional 4-hydroxy-2-oxoglutarate aldolase/2-dehydro-3-deoxy-phosphogluconate aldolase [Leucobacter allii]|uniref:Bifunctional 4-hydroxy-2-oxoglutarate aldolase/2-dehydro-3-deoxy-phosphogluconate aldolase n=1 Tax=Leucobacter allii TaxID=2932247 RepID=A0ABY4FNX9_9MICO|nr:bifunctional 4-hydroxy-2-oxoglutarate aldolase/2-dehydro-3-deoxy-phosphogluconate aldolase [Leucobacter allii]UOQ57924.1 bifunctional 4-hydroxy-2-oxoglutarate aldolase/2-dehydro-3-deoxy-phosphogluconate aldolase [Leucobacter allii]UOR02556.1 bifunctional 4-hydroxy-2-oxoglutarate aldolase/2-dehydro-3-deoxy-phosphogluconate aldolase [Leucobacter allii]